ncbi:hypothetical protein U1Q18_013854 [Sarracenia purpurea var. burkii]
MLCSRSGSWSQVPGCCLCLKWILVRLLIEVGLVWCLSGSSLLRSCGSGLLLSEMVGLAADKREVGFASGAAATAQNGVRLMVQQHLSLGSYTGAIAFSLPSLVFRGPVGYALFPVVPLVFAGSSGAPFSVFLESKHFLLVHPGWAALGSALWLQWHVTMCIVLYILVLGCSAVGLIMDLLGVFSVLASLLDAEGPYALSNTRIIGSFHWLIYEVYVPVPNR